jgi:pyridinium-3,5-bisthiocarboxylic acid mononucleotide nickel chelatase
LVRAAYFDCFAGVSGDMILGALIDAGLPFADLESELKLLGLGGYRMCAEGADRSSIAATRVEVQVSAGTEAERTLSDVLGIVTKSRLPDGDKTTIAAIFKRLADAEAQVHGKTPDSVHFHDVGAVDAIVDIAGAVAGLRLLGIEKVYSSGIPLGSGSVAGAHGVLPVPAPATLALVAQGGVPVRTDPVKESGELSTPTGVAILVTIARFKRPELAVESAGYGAGGRDPAGYPNVLRVWVGEPIQSGRRSEMLEIETNIDDMPAEQLAYAIEQLLAAGAADAWFTPIQMKKGRPGVMLSLLCSEDLEDKLAAIILRETSTFGLRVRRVWRYEADREIVSFESSLGPVSVKVRRIPGEPLLVSPEFDDCRAIAETKRMPLHEVMNTVRREAEASLQTRGKGRADSPEFTIEP